MDRAFVIYDKNEWFCSRSYWLSGLRNTIDINYLANVEFI